MNANLAPKKLRVRASVLDQARRLCGFTSDEQLGAELGLSSTTVRNLRHGRTSPTLITALKISRLAGVPIEGLIVEQADESAPAA
jgi:DNA-binding helix-turn-helix protein|uniref:Putative transcriptional regulator n=1 Tax=Siphoviridae sp. ctvph17 TaxID=2825724 RepID=A0A8S5UJK3_9CAUD|nr:MAG TPA: putative transcriptional regulator [Siphoviridae sp. ctvph17]DAS81230.1 MAG TPA: putative transcriptional regulator [Caudoviricetes sp.]DAS85758.1 MAG TPA: putative transcriptional regulator [Caudoviricetes sp.]